MVRALAAHGVLQFKQLATVAIVCHSPLTVEVLFFWKGGNDNAEVRCIRAILFISCTRTLRPKAAPLATLIKP